MHCYICKYDFKDGEPIVLCNGKLAHMSCKNDEDSSKLDDLEEKIRNKLPEAFKHSAYEISDTMISAFANRYYLLEDETDEYMDTFETIYDAIHYLKERICAESEYIIYDSTNHCVIYLDIEYVIKMRNESKDNE